MKALTLMLWTGIALFFAANAHAQSQAVIEFTGGGFSTDQSVIDQLDEVYTALTPGHSVQLIVISDYERRKKDGIPGMLSKRRSQKLQQLLVRQGVPEAAITISCEISRNSASHAPSGSDWAYSATGIYSISILKEKPMPLWFASDKVNRFEDAQCTGAMIDQSRTEFIYSYGGVVVEIPAYAFEYTNGLPLDDNRVEVQLCDFMTKSAFLTADLTTNSGKKHLESGGMVHVSATCNGEELRLRRGATITVSIPTDADKLKDDMMVFHGEGQYNVLNWDRSLDSKITVQREEDLWNDESIESDFYEDLDGEWYGENSILDGYIMESSSLGWINCDRFLEIEEPVDLMVDLDQRDSVSVRLIFTSINSVLPGYYYNSEKLVKFEGVPNGEKAILLAYSKKDDGVLFASREVVLGEESLSKLVLQKKSNREFKDWVASVDRNATASLSVK